jgi:hypothetical protein
MTKTDLRRALDSFNHSHIVLDMAVIVD